jgi:hypothetical protein
MDEFDSIIAGIGRSRAAAALKLLKAGWSVGAPVDKYSRPGIFVSGGDTRLSIMVRLDEADVNEWTGAAILDEVRDWPGVSDTEMKQHDTGTVFIRLTYKV